MGTSELKAKIQWGGLLYMVLFGPKVSCLTAREALLWTAYAALQQFPNLDMDECLTTRRDTGVPTEGLRHS